MCKVIPEEHVLFLLTYICAYTSLETRKHLQLKTYFTVGIGISRTMNAEERGTEKLTMDRVEKSVCLFLFVGMCVYCGGCINELRPAIMTTLVCKSQWNSLASAQVRTVWKRKKGKRHEDLFCMLVSDETTMNLCLLLLFKTSVIETSKKRFFY